MEGFEAAGLIEPALGEFMRLMGKVKVFVYGFDVISYLFILHFIEKVNNQGFKKKTNR